MEVLQRRYFTALDIDYIVLKHLPVDVNSTSSYNLISNCNYLSYRPRISSANKRAYHLKSKTAL